MEEEARGACSRLDLLVDGALVGRVQLGLSGDDVSDHLAVRARLGVVALVGAGKTLGHGLGGVCSMLTGHV